MQSNASPQIVAKSRWRRFGRAMIGVAICVITSYAWRFVSNRVAQNALDAEIARLRGLGQIVTVDDFNSQPPIPDADNAAVLYKQAFLTPRTPAQEEFYTNVDVARLMSDDRKAVLRTFPVTFAKSLQLARQARQRKLADFAEVMTSPMLQSLQPRLNDSRDLANVIKFSTVAAHLDGRDSDAVEYVRDLLHLAAMLDQRNATIVSHLVSIGISAMASDQAMALSQDLRLGPAPAASAEQVRGLIADLLDPSLDRGLAESLKGEQAGAIDTANAMSARTGNSAVGSFKQTTVRWTQFMSARIADIDAESVAHTMVNWNTYQAGSKPDLFELLLPSLTKSIPLHFRVKSDARAAAVMLAARLYRQDHQNAWPSSLDALVPSYLPAVPRDLFSPAGGPMQYVSSMTVDGVTTPVLYSVGDDGVDQHASIKLLMRRPRVEKVWSDPWNHEDAVYPFLRPPPEPPDADSNRGN
jgi:hypothetical protein